jgi:hypothetical protein
MKDIETALRKIAASPVQYLNALIIDGLVAIEQMVHCEKQVKDILATQSNQNLETISSNIFVINAWIQEEMRKRKGR